MNGLKVNPMTIDYIARIRRIIREMLAETDSTGAPLWQRPSPYDRSDSANRFRDELHRRMKIESDRAALARMAEMSGEGDGY